MDWIIVTERTHNEIGWVHPTKRLLDAHVVALDGRIRRTDTAENRIMKKKVWNNKFAKNERIRMMGRTDDPTFMRRYRTLLAAVSTR